MCLTIGFQRAGQLRLDLVPDRAVIQLAELHSDAGGAITLGALRCDPDDAARNR